MLLSRIAYELCRIRCLGCAIEEGAEVNEDFVAIDVIDCGEFRTGAFFNVVVDCFSIIGLLNFGAPLEMYWGVSIVEIIF